MQRSTLYVNDETKLGAHVMAGEFQPGDGTRYVFTAVQLPGTDDYLVSGNFLNTFEVNHTSVIKAADGGARDPYVLYIADKGRTRPAAAWAFIQWFTETLARRAT